ncbi:MAG: hypothetical protein IT494_01240 [Gammaproteobacteria bacterium]|nr:hypothetical protein [Gammaproteobacteria bacterium]
MKPTRAVALLLATLAIPAGAEPPAVKPACDRTCLSGFVDRYIDAMVAHQVSDDLFAREVKFTENGIRLPFGSEGSWFLATGRGKYSFYVPDEETQQIAFLGTLKESGRAQGQDRTVGLSLRLRIRDGKIAEVEQLVTRPATSLTGGGNNNSSPFPETGTAVEAMGEPHARFKQDIPEKERASRAELIETANYYFTGLQRNDGKGYYPFTDDCIRFENGMDVLANIMDPETQQRGRMTCKRQFEAALKGIVSRVRDRRFVAVDRQKGIVFAFAFFDHERINWTWQLAELFKIENGRISRIEAIFHQAPYGIASGWSTYEQSVSDEIQDVR